MKYYTELTVIENEIIRLSCMESMLRVTACGITEASRSVEDAENVLWHLQGGIEDIHNKLRDGFDAMWEADRSSGTNGSFVSTLKTNDYVEPENDSWKMLEEVTRKWAAKK
jgi:hypothetical protein